MAALELVPTPKLLFDRQECYNDLAALAIAKLSGLTHYSGGTIVDRAESNLKMIKTIEKECRRRGFDPADFHEVSTHGRT
jgi:hypothetical protein